MAGTGQPGCAAVHRPRMAFPTAARGRAPEHVVGWLTKCVSAARQRGAAAANTSGFAGAAVAEPAPLARRLSGAASEERTPGRSCGTVGKTGARRSLV